jgi:ferredoxin
MKLKTVLQSDSTKRKVLVAGQVVPDQARCVQCGICSFNCPIGIDVRSYAWRGAPVADSHCLTCGECVARCPRGVLRFEEADLFRRGSG